MHRQYEFTKNYLLNRSFESVKQGFNLFLAILLIALFFGLNTPYAAELWFTPKVGVSGGYDDNILFNKEEKVNSSFINVEPSAKLKYKSLLSTLTMNADWDFLNYLDESDFNRVNHDYSIKAAHQITQRWDANIELRYRKDSTLNSYLEDTGRVINLLDRDYYYALGGISYDISATSWVNAEYSYTKAQYEDDEYPDYDRHTVDLRYDHRLNSQIDVISIGPSYYYRTNELNDTDYFSLDIGWKRRWSDITKSFVSIGARYADIQYVDEEEEYNEDRSDWGVRARVDLNHEGITSSTIFKYYHDVDTTADGIDVNVDNLYLQYRFLVTERFRMGIQGRLIFSYNLFSSENRDNSDDEIDNSRYYDLQPFLEYQIFKELGMSLNYRYQNSSEDPIDSENVSGKNRVWIEFFYSLPIKM